ncbi:MULTISPECIES: hypothetical protein [Geobacillus]|jgi:hypothetical protein|uniref:Uncharacterized protein n=2 Tax=Geobacillus thermodenitrificans TaxID=33940 RepID=A4ILA3_GEOTN|nr:MULTISPECIES: hypothetical protein [Geobacillus]ABO66107.1 Conserved hypothetical protein [Geobacillus thermodenitrificans NG80-2]ARA97458.1 hypothetical protein GD3902_04925 [Geobacillus thermodenitrificans]ARP41837.1 hypothetical protein GTHT12_00272 [Geobacillus thermodenitrificans]ATO36784.1 hypothetical protein GTID1_05815 [Geobacillus thermodenitrificans]KQB94436.1 hypothetical protein GEPA3_0796 [Geobacillus sp. PA-3]
MGHYHRRDKEKVCIRTRKIYDWVTRQVDVPLRSFSGDDLETIFPSANCPRQGTICEFLASQSADPQSFTIRCFLSDAEGNPIDPTVDHDALICQEITQSNGRQPVNVTLPSGETVTLQKVKALVKGHVVVQIVSPTGTVICESAPIPFATAQTFILCAPEGTQLNCHISFFECDTSLVCTDNFNQLDVSITLCLEVQMEADVKIEVEARFCQPREELAEGVTLCPTKKFPPQCPDVFPAM